MTPTTQPTEGGVDLDKLLNAVINVGHIINDEEVRLFRNPQLGGNALDQLGKRLRYALAKPRAAQAAAAPGEGKGHWEPLGKFAQRWVPARRASTAEGSAEPSGDDGLPALPEPRTYCVSADGELHCGPLSRCQRIRGNFEWEWKDEPHEEPEPLYTATQVRQAQRDAIASRDATIAELREKVAEQQRVIDVANVALNDRVTVRLARHQGGAQQPVGWLYDWTHSSALGRPDEHFTGFTTDREHAFKPMHTNARAVYAAPVSAPGAQGETIEQTRANFEDWYLSHIEGADLSSRDCANRWSAWLAGSTGHYKAPSSWKIRPMPWNYPEESQQGDERAKMMTLLQDAACAWNNERESELDSVMERVECFLIQSRAPQSPAVRDGVLEGKSHPYHRDLGGLSEFINAMCGGDSAKIALAEAAWYRCMDRNHPANAAAQVPQDGGQEGGA